MIDKPDVEENAELLLDELAASISGTVARTLVERTVYYAEADGYLRGLLEALEAAKEIRRDKDFTDWGPNASDMYESIREHIERLIRAAEAPGGGEKERG